MANDIIYDDVKGICDRVNLDILHDAIILVTGASGLIGTYILACLCHLREQGIPMQVYAHHLSPLPSHVASLIARGDFQSVQANLAAFDECRQLPEADVILHAAGYAQPSLFMRDPVTTIQVNTCATFALLKKLRSNGRFVFISSAEVYSGLRNSPFSEESIGTTTPFHPRAAYIEGKRCGEAICSAFRSQGVHATSVRMADVYGPGTRKHDTRALNSFIEKAVCHHKIELLDSGKAIRTYCYVSDAVELLWDILLYGKVQVYNIGGQLAVTIAELAEMIGSVAAVPVIYPKKQGRVAGSPDELRLDLSRVEREFSKREYVSLEDGLRSTIEWQRKLYLL